MLPNLNVEMRREKLSIKALWKTCGRSYIGANMDNLCRQASMKKEQLQVARLETRDNLIVCVERSTSEAITTMNLCGL